MIILVCMTIGCMLLMEVVSYTGSQQSLEQHAAEERLQSNGQAGTSAALDSGAAAKGDALHRSQNPKSKPADRQFSPSYQSENNFAYLISTAECASSTFIKDHISCSALRLPSIICF